MENKINVAELLKDCPKGMELDCTLFEGLEFDGIVDNEYLPIRCRIKNPNGGYYVYNFTKYGCWLDTTFAKCVIFPKGKTTWEGFQRPFKDGDIVAVENRACSYITIFRKLIDNTSFSHHACLTSFGKFKIDDFADNSNLRIATEEEKQKLFDAIKANGYKWNEETKTLEKLMTPNKFDITTLKPFDKVLVRYNSFEKWHIQFFEKYNTELGAKYPFICLCNSKYCQCIPYEGNEHLFGTTNDCDNYYKTW